MFLCVNLTPFTDDSEKREESKIKIWKERWAESTTVKRKFSYQTYDSIKLENE